MQFTIPDSKQSGVVFLCRAHKTEKNSRLSRATLLIFFYAGLVEGSTSG